jgi:RNA polymerase sigma-70 factor, ECF subfamily
MITQTTQIHSSDDELIKAISGGDRNAMRLLYARHSVRIFRFAMRIVSDESVAEDVVNEVFLDVWRKAGGFEGRSQVSTWLLAITRFKALAMGRRRPLDPLDDEVCETIEDGADDPETVMGKRQTSSLLFRCLEKLSPAHREIIDLVYYHDKAVDEVAEIIQVPRNTVKTRMFYARNHLAKLLAEARLDRDLLAA